MGGVNNGDVKHGSKARSSIPKLFPDVQGAAMLVTKSHVLMNRREPEASSWQGAGSLRAELCSKGKPECSEGLSCSSGLLSVSSAHGKQKSGFGAVLQEHAANAPGSPQAHSQHWTLGAAGASTAQQQGIVSFPFYM